MIVENTFDIDEINYTEFSSDSNKYILEEVSKQKYVKFVIKTINKESINIIETNEEIKTEPDFI